MVEALKLQFYVIGELVLSQFQHFASTLFFHIGTAPIPNRNLTMKSLSLFLAALLALPVPAIAENAVKIDVYLAGVLEQSVSLKGANSTVKFSPRDTPATTCELRLIAPEPLIVEMKETSTDGSAEVFGRAKIPSSGGSFAVSEMKGAKFRSPYVLVRHD